MRGVPGADGLSGRLLGDAQALAAVAARLRLDELGVEGDPAVRAQLDRVVDTLGVRDQISALEEGQRAVLLAFSRSYLAQALDLVDDPVHAARQEGLEPLSIALRGVADAGPGSCRPGAGSAG